MPGPDALHRETTKGKSMAEDVILAKKTKRGPCQYNYNPWEKISGLNANITIGELAQMAPVVRSSIQHGLRDSKPM